MKRPNYIRVNIECITNARVGIRPEFTPTFLRYLSECKSNYWFALSLKKRIDFLDKRKMSVMLDQPDPLFEKEKENCLQQLEDFITNPKHKDRRMVVRTGINQL